MKNEKSSQPVCTKCFLPFTEKHFNVGNGKCSACEPMLAKIYDKPEEEEDKTSLLDSLWYNFCVRDFLMAAQEENDKKEKRKPHQD